MTMTYRQLRKVLQEMDDSRLDDEATVYDAYRDEFLTVTKAEIVFEDEQDVLDEGHLYLVMGDGDGDETNVSKDFHHFLHTVIITVALYTMLAGFLLPEHPCLFLTCFACSGILAGMIQLGRIQWKKKHNKWIIPTERYL